MLLAPVARPIAAIFPSSCYIQPKLYWPWYDYIYYTNISYTINNEITLVLDN